ncbi:MAG: hypothetical protein AB7N91_10600 [Candidatus Tectimicrobiota bacterium]
MRFQHRMWLLVGCLCALGAVETPWQNTWAQPAHAPKEHLHEAPHGGQIATAGKYHLELVLQNHQTVQVYLYDETFKPATVPRPEATLYLRLPGNKQHTLTLTAVGGTAATAWTATTDLLRGVPAFEAALRVALEGEARNIRFVYPGGHAHREGQPGVPHKH